MKKRQDLIRGYAVLSTAAMFVLMFLLFINFVIAIAEPQGPTTVSIAGSGRFTNNTAPVISEAQAGNVTALVITNTRATEAWQGYYGNITGTITLDDASNSTLYDWSLPAPSGEVYASNSSLVTWSKVYCMNVSADRNYSGVGSGLGGGQYYTINGTGIELNFGINVSDRDGLNETFNDTYTDTTGFRVGSITIDRVDGCSLAHPYTSQAYLETGWQELLLTDNSSVIFTGLVRDSANGFETGATDTYDFQLMVLENGHVGSETTTTPYYFFVELS